MDRLHPTLPLLSSKPAPPVTPLDRALSQLLTSLPAVRTEDLALVNAVGGIKDALTGKK